MGWTTPYDGTAGEIITEAIWDTYLKDNLRYLKGLDGAVTLSDALILPDGAGYYLHIPILTTAQRDALTATAGMLIYNSSTTQFNKYENGAWRADLGFNSHHGDLSGQTDDDHTQYQKENLLTTAGDIAYATAGSTWARLPIGAIASQVLRTNATLDAPEWASPVGINIQVGTYNGDNSANRAIAHSLGTTSKLVIIYDTAGSNVNFLISDNAAIVYITDDGGLVGLYAVTAMNATNFYVGNAASYPRSANATGSTYYWAALG